MLEKPATRQVNCSHESRRSFMDGGRYPWMINFREWGCNRYTDVPVVSPEKAYMLRKTANY